MKRILPIILAFVLVGCGSSTSSETVETVETIQETGVEKDGTVQLRIWGAEEDQAMLAQMGESFKAKYASEADIELIFEPQSESNCKDVLLGDVLNAADVFAFADDQLLSLAASGVLMEVENADAIKAANLTEAVSAATIGDRLFAFPMTADNGYFMYYNKEYFTEEQVQSMDAMLLAAEEAGKKIAMDWSSGWYTYSFFGNTGMEFGLNEDGVTNYCTWNGSGNGVTGADVAAAMYKIAQSPAFASMINSDFIAGVQDGSVIACVSGVWDAANVKAALGDNWAATVPPTITINGEAKQLMSFGGSKAIAVNPNCENPKAAAALAAWLGSADAQLAHYEFNGTAPVSVALMTENEEISSNPSFKAAVDTVGTASIAQPSIPEMNSFWGAAEAMGNAIYNGEVTHDNAEEKTADFNVSLNETGL